MTLGPSSDPQPNPRPGSSLDIVRRMERIEANHEALVKEVAALTSTVTRMELNQSHAAELNALRFSAIDTSIKSMSDVLDRFIVRINGIIAGEISTPQTKIGEAMVAEYQSFRKETIDFMDSQAVLNGQVKLIARLAVIIVGGNALTIAAVIYRFIAP